MSGGVRGDILNFLKNPVSFANGVVPTQQEVWLRGLTDFAEPILGRPGMRSLRPAQLAAWRGLADQRAGLILGPPGTGKTFLVAWLAAGYIWARRRSGLPCRVLVTGFTRESMGNLIDAISLILSQHLSGVPAAFMGNLPDSDVLPEVGRLSLKNRDDKRAAWRYLTDNRELVLAATNWSLSKLFKAGAHLQSDGRTARVFDLVLIDEASQMLVSQGLMSLAGLAEEGRVVVAGDDRQLGPVRPTFEVETEGGRALGSSLYSFLKSSGVREFPLEETFRLNEPLVAFPREHLYGGQYFSAMPERRLQLRPGWRSGLEPWQSAVLDPEHPVVVLIHDAPPGGTENPFERHHIRHLVALLGERMLPAVGMSGLDEETFWGDRLAVITPHRAQNAALREELRPLPLCDNTYVETVDRIQGRERDAVIAGYTVSDPEFAAQIAQFIFNSQRLNVTVTRARNKLVLFVSRRLLEVIPRDDAVFDDAYLLREYLYECELVDRVELSGPDGVAHRVELRVRRFADAASDSGMRGAEAAAGVSADEGGLPMQVVHLRYAGEELTNARLMQELGLAGTPYTYMVATSALEQLRWELAPPHQRSEGKAVLKFDEVLRNMLKVPLLTRTVERVFLKRSIEESIPDPGVTEQVRHDLFSWLEALTSLAEENINLTGGAGAALRERFVSNATADILTLLQTEHNLRKADSGRQSFETAAYEFLAEPFAITPNVVMEGFTYLTPLQRDFVQACLALDSRVHFVYPYAEGQRRGFSIMNRTYEVYDPVSVYRDVEARELPEEPTALQFLKRALFAAETAAPPANDESLTLRAYPHRHGEVEACMARIAEYLNSGQFRADDIAIVTRNPREFDTLLHERARRHGLSERLSLPPRMLLLTPLGRFALTLYEIRRDGEFRMSPEQFETILASGWLGAFVQGTADTFRAVRPQVFERCSAAAEWYEAFNRLRRMLSETPDSRLPASAVDAPTLALWRDALRTVERLCERLFAVPEMSIGEHIKRLQDELSQLVPEIVRRAEREVIEKIRVTLEQVVDTGELRISGEEFGDILNSLVKEYQHDAEAGAGTPEDGKIWVTSPEGLDSFVPPERDGPFPRPKKVIFFLGVDDQRVPRRAPDPWPFFEDNLDENQDRERYLFLAVVRTAGARLHLSYARRGEATAYQPSPYMEELKRVAGAEILGDETAPAAEPAPSYEPPPLPSVRRDDYLLHEIAEYGLCPYRYKLERLAPEARLCRDLFQMAFEAQGAWLGRIYDRASDRQVNGYDQLEALLLAAKDASRAEVREMFGALRDVTWREVEDKVAVSLRNEARYLSGFNFPVRVERARAPVTFTVAIGSRSITVDCGLQHTARTGRVQRPLLNGLLSREWMLPTSNHRSESNAPARTNVGGLALFTNLYHAIQWWEDAARVALAVQDPRAPASYQPSLAALQADCAALINHIESGRYPKHPGDHCRYCPAQDICLAVPEGWS